MCARLLACPLCSQPGFLTLDALRAGLVSVATRPLMCPVCNEVLLGIDKLTIHLFSHTINLNDAGRSSKHINIVTPSENLVAVYNAHNTALQDWNILKTQQLGKVQVSNDSNKTCMEPDSGISIVENKISIQNLQPQTQSQNLSMKNANQHTFISDYNCDVIKVDILPQPNEDHSVMLKPTANLQKILKENRMVQHSCNDNIKCSNLSHENAELEKTVMLDFHPNWVKNQVCKSLTATKVTTVDTNIYQTETEYTESSNKQYITKERLKMNSTDKETELSDFRPIQDIIPSCAEMLREKHNDKQSLYNLRETALETSTKNQEQNTEHSETLPHVQACTKIFRTIAPKEKTERCNICGFHFPDINILALHKQLAHMVNEQDLNNIPEKLLKNYSCHLCSKVFKMRGSLMVHMRVAHIGYNLGKANNMFKDSQVELTYGDAGYNCPTCGKRFKKEQHVIQHLKTHEGKQWECDICSKMFTTKYFLKKHKRLHSGEMPYKCNICDKNFTFQQSYHKHRLYHKDDKPHTCATCGRSFKELSTLHNHERIHTGEKPFACETCGKCFRQRVSYLVHRRIHTGVMPYKCTMCGKSFRYKVPNNHKMTIKYVSQRTHKCLSQTSENIQQSSDVIVQKMNDVSFGIQRTLPENQLAASTVDNEENKFVLIVNDQGQHILARQTEINNISVEKKKQNLECAVTNNINKNLKNKIWNINNCNSIEFEKFAESSEKLQLDNDRMNIKNSNDFFSIVMSSFESSMSSPTFEMEHLRVSSPKQKEHSTNSFNDFPKVPDNAQMNTTDPNMKQSFDDRDNTDSLQTINEDSLKELLYGIDGK